MALRTFAHNTSFTTCQGNPRSREAEVIQLALEQNIRQVCLDDLRGRRIALASGLRVTGALGLLVLAKSIKIVPSIKPYCERLLKNGAWYSPSLLQKILASVGE